MLQIEELNTDQLIELYSKIPEVLKSRGIIRTNNILGDFGEYLAIQHYKNTPGLPNLQAAPPGTQNVDAMSRNGERYSIKATRGNGTGVFYGLGDPSSIDIEKQKFEYLIVIQFSDSYKIRKMLELNWDQFLKHKKWHSRMRAWNIGISKALISDSKILVDN